MNGKLFIYEREPKIVDHPKMWFGGMEWEINHKWFTEITWENSPRKVTLTLAEE